MTRASEWVTDLRRIARDPDGGALLIHVPPGDPTDVFSEMAAEARRLGFVAVLVDRTTGEIPPALLHRHVFVYGAGAPGRLMAARWVRALALTSPRLHIVAASVEVAAATEGVAGAVCDDWRDFSRAAAARAGALAASNQFAALRAWTRSVRTEARLRGVPPPLMSSAGTRSIRMQLLEDFSGLLSLIEDAPDDQALLEGACRWLARRSPSVRVAILSADRLTMLAGEGWRRADAGAEIAAILDGPARDVRAGRVDASVARFGVSVRYSGTIVGHVVVACGDGEGPALRAPALALAAFGAAAVRGRLDAMTIARRGQDAVSEIVGESPPIVAVREAIVRAAAAPFNVLIEGESGTGKELVARALHRLSPRRDRRLQAVNCAALTDELIEAELFGHTRGAFTGAVAPRAGLFEEAHGGTLFLDEVTELSARAQAKLLRVLQEREIRRLGENAARAVDVRVVAACNVPLASAAARGLFRDDLRFRLAVIRIPLPALRDRAEDIPALTHLFWRRVASESKTRATLGPDALARLVRHPFPGNIRELQNVVAALAVLAPLRGRVTAHHVDQVLVHAEPVAPTPGMRLEAARLATERRVVTAALVRNAGHRTAAARELGLTRQGLTKALRRLGVSDDELTAGVA